MIWSRVRGILTVDALDGLELASCVPLLAIGIWLMLPLDTIAGVAIYRPMYELLPHEYAWSACALVLGGLQAWALASGRIALRRVASFLAAFLWGFLSIMTGIGNIASLASPVYGALALLIGLSYLRLSLPRGGT